MAQEWFEEKDALTVKEEKQAQSFDDKMTKLEPSSIEKKDLKEESTTKVKTCKFCLINNGIKILQKKPPTSS